MSIELYQLELNQSIVNCGMSYVFRFENGEFLLIDGGYFTPGEEDTLYNFLVSKCEKKPVIKAWIFTHAHQDHIGCFINFIEKYHDKVKIDSLLYNFQPTKHLFAFGSWSKKCNDLATVKHFYKIVKKYSSYFEVHRLITDDTLIINDLSLKVLYTSDNLYPEKASFNDYSAVIKIYAGNTSILFLGDVQNKGSEYLLKNKKNELKSDIVQLSHHGFNGATEELYSAINPDVVLWPAPDFEFEKNKNSDVNNFVLNSINVKECFVSGFGDCLLKLPYNLGTAEQFSKKYD